MRFGILFGPPGIGKGTIGKVLSEKWNYPIISTGDVLRDSVKEATDIGKKAEIYMKKGELVPDEIVFEALKEKIGQQNSKPGILIDGFPRNINQAIMLDRIFKNDDKIVVLNFVASDSVVIERLSLRRICKNCGAIYHLKNIPPKKEGECDVCGGELIQRDDDKPHVIARRLEVFRNETKPLLEYYSKKYKVITVDASDNLEKIIKKVEEHKLWE
ncbi:MAG: nucleoside monophosphate kinase [Candidatus Omnitrophica bacterium]|nr:nucleoside monophosphate kinase [Candidatus Omnitrophota bacterium]MCM8816687.1 nucleoside monophosphate kinase [Candidatus Omnitrophota bacterium]